MTYSEAKAYLDEIATKNKSARDQLRMSKNMVANTKALLDAMPAMYSSVIADIDTASASSPNDGAWKVAKAELAQLVSDFIALQNVADQIKTALSSFDV
tara:strand:- start:37 stop:333 length:297 start_codon:yes stop_codon:yes gene_type:complete